MPLGNCSAFPLLSSCFRGVISLWLLVKAISGSRIATHHCQGVFSLTNEEFHVEFYVPPSMSEETSQDPPSTPKRDAPWTPKAAGISPATPKRFQELLADTPLESKDQNALNKVLVLSSFPKKLRAEFLQIFPTADEFIMAASSPDALDGVIANMETDKLVIKQKPLRVLLVNKLVQLATFLRYQGNLFADPTPTFFGCSQLQQICREPSSSPVHLFLVLRKLIQSQQLRLFRPLQLGLPSEDLAATLEKNPWDKTEESYPEWKDRTVVNLGQVPKFKRVIMDQNAASQDSYRSEIAFSSLLAAFEGSDIYDTIRHLTPQTGYAAWKKMEELMEGEDKMALYRKRAESLLLNVCKSTDITVNAYHSQLSKIFALFKAAKEEYTEPRQIEEALRHIADPDFENIKQDLHRRRRSGELTTMSELFNELVNRENDVRIEEIPAPGTVAKGRRLQSNLKSSDDDRKPSARVSFDFSKMALPKRLWDNMSDHDQAYFMKWKKEMVSNHGNFQALRDLSPPKSASVERGRINMVPASARRIKESKSKRSPRRLAELKVISRNKLVKTLKSILRLLVVSAT